ncbi:protein of unknown function [Dyadobacter koreensis]|uniref:DUF4403 family protein n=1 Tax=Dyadobacter koreensis TaxID=408657 RepID=A0A1H6RWG3_9BACT|nr:DUF4403 family protein [Dyadobacter koreensis]SEI57824.1 protein of unknown function [Dyadobacter koreensis]
MRVIWVLLFAAIGLAQWSCRSKTTSPKKPMEEYLYSDAEIQNEKHLSVVNLPIEMPVSELETQINAQLKGLIYEDDSFEDNGGDNLKAKVWKINPIRVVAKDSTFLFEVPLKIWVNAGYKVSPLGINLSGYKDTEFSIRIRLISKIGISPNWKLHTETYVDSYDWISEPNVKVAGIRIPIKGMVSRLLNHNFEKITQAIDNQVAGGIEVKKYVEAAWNLARQPILLSKEFDTWLVVTPNAIIMTPLLVTNNILRSSIGIKGFTQTITSAVKPAVKPAPKLPDLTITDKVTSDFRIGLISLISYEDAARMATARLAGQKYSFLGGKYNVEVSSIEMYGQNERLIIKAGLQGSISGSIYLKGIPYYDPKTQQLSLKDLDYDLDTRNTIVKTAGWLLQGKFSKMMEKEMVFPVGSQMNEAKKSVQQILANYKVTDGVQIKGTLLEITPDKVYLTPKHIYSVVFAQGNINLRVEGLRSFDQ